MLIGILVLKHMAFRLLSLFNFYCVATPCLDILRFSQRVYIHMIWHKQSWQPQFDVPEVHSASKALFKRHISVNRITLLCHPEFPTLHLPLHASNIIIGYSALLPVR